MKFDKIKPGMVLYDRHKYRAGNTTIRVLGEWPVRIISVDPERFSAVVSWNGNQPETWSSLSLMKLKDWSMYDDCAEITRGMLGPVAVRKKRNPKPAPSAPRPGGDRD